MEEIEVISAEEIGRPASEDYKITDEFIEVLDGKGLRITPETEGFDYSGILDTVLQFADMGSIAKDLKNGVEFVAKIPVEWLEAFENGEVQIMESAKNHKLWPTLVRILDDGKQEIVKPLELERKVFPDKEALHNLTENAHNVLMAKKLSDISHQIDEVRKKVDLIDQGLEADRESLLDTGKQAIEIALKSNDPLLLADGRGKLLEGCNKITNAMVVRSDNIPQIPSSWLVRVGKAAVHPDFLQEARSQYKKLENMYQLWMYGNKMLAASYVIEGKPQIAETVFNQALESIQKLKPEKFKPLENVYPALKEKGFHRNTIEQINYEKKVCLDDTKKFDYLEINLTPGMLPEGEEYEKSEI